jgi:hypothetical protein
MACHPLELALSDVIHPPTYPVSWIDVRSKQLTRPLRTPKDGNVGTRQNGTRPNRRIYVLPAPILENTTLCPLQLRYPPELSSSIDVPSRWPSSLLANVTGHTKCVRRLYSCSQTSISILVPENSRPCIIKLGKIWLGFILPRLTGN